MGAAKNTINPQYAPDGLAVDAKGNVYAVSSETGNVQKFNPAGKLIAKWGAKGDGQGKFNFPNSIAVNSSGNIFVSDPGGKCVQKLNALGKFIAKLTLDGGIFADPEIVAADSKGGVYVLVNGRDDTVQRIDSSGKLVSKLGTHGPGKGEFIMPNAITVDSAGNLYVAEPGAGYSYEKDGQTISGQTVARIQKFDPSGKYVTSLAEGGTEDADLGMMSAIAIDAKGNFYVLGMDYVKKYDSSGKFLLMWGSMGHEQGEFEIAKSLAVDMHGNVYVGDSVNGRIQKFDSSGKFITQWHMQ